MFQFGLGQKHICLMKRLYNNDNDNDKSLLSILYYTEINAQISSNNFKKRCLIKRELIYDLEV